MTNNNYLMESNDEILRLELKTDRKTVESQALWAGIKPGMRIMDIGCGSGKTTSILHDLVQPAGLAIGVDSSEIRINHAKSKYGIKGIEFINADIRKPLDELGMFDFIWVRFVLEYFLSHSFQIVKNLSRVLRPGGILCLIDLDYNCLNHFGLSQKMERTLHNIMRSMEERADFDAYAGRKLYSYLYDLGFQDIKVDVGAHHLIYGDLKEADAFNWFKKLEVATKKIGFQFEEHEGGYEAFCDEFRTFFSDPRRFTYSPIISCCGRKPLN